MRTRTVTVDISVQELLTQYGKHDSRMYSVGLMCRCIFSMIWFLANHSLYVIVRPSVCLSVVCNAHAPALLRWLKFSVMFLRHLVRWPSIDIPVKFYVDSPRGTPPSVELNTTRVAEYSNVGPIECCSLCRKRCKIGGKLVLITNRKSHELSIGTKCDLGWLWTV